MNDMENEVGAFRADIYGTVMKIPKGCVATYAQVALMSGHRGAARAVGNALHVNPYFGVVPCHRVVNAKGRLASDFAFGGVGEQARLLTEEGVAVEGGAVDLEKYQWR